MRGSVKNANTLEGRDENMSSVFDKESEFGKVKKYMMDSVHSERGPGQIDSARYVFKVLLKMS